MNELKIVVVDDGRDFAARLDSLPRVGDKLVIGLMGKPESFTVKEVVFDLSGPTSSSLTLASVTINVTQK
ncbi:hypothetical protein AB0284_20380 [Pseudarthrobacter phenanthrenivorans]|uniref:hypothetical protein n=1 Tax=Pseudarthrobacter phenanthrenivorans TaxID=361575 RepID=UPI00344F2BBA